MSHDKKIILAVTGASGSIYAQRLLEVLGASDDIQRIYLIASDTGIKVVDHELKSNPDNPFDMKHLLKREGKPHEKIRVFDNADLYAPIASGSSAATHTIITPCSMGALGRIANGVSTTLIERSADVALKQKYPLIICPRETPFNSIHLQNMLTLDRAGAHLIPLMPAFYQKPQSMEDLVDFMVGKILESIGVSHQLYRPWNSRLR